MKTNPALIEPLEARIAPAALATLNLSLDGHTATYTDVDGDRVTIKVRGFPVGGGVLTTALFSGVGTSPGHEQLQMLDLSGGGFNKANLTFSVAKVPGDRKSVV